MNSLETKVEAVKQDIVDVNKKLDEIKFYTEFEQLDLTPGSETIESIAKSLPNNGHFYYYKRNGVGNASIYPNASGSLTVIRYVTSSRIAFRFERVGRFWVGYYDELNNPKWSGWIDLTDKPYALTNSEGASPTIPSGITNLSTFRTSGMFYITNALINNITDRPFNSAGWLQVTKTTTNEVIQQFTANNNTTGLGLIATRVVNSAVGKWFRNSVTMTGDVPPEGVAYGSVGANYLDTTSKIMYYKTTDFTNTGWRAYTNA